MPPFAQPWYCAMKPIVAGSDPLSSFVDIGKDMAIGVSIISTSPKYSSFTTLPRGNDNLKMT